MKYPGGRNPGRRTRRRAGRLCCLLLALGELALADQDPAAARAAGETPGAGSGRSAAADLASGGVVEANHVPLTGRQRLQVYVRRTFVPGGACFGPLFSSIRDQAKGTPGEWGGGMEGYSRRLGSRLGQTVIRGTVRSGAAAVLGEDPRPILKREGSLGGRIGHAAAFSVLTLDDRGRRRVSVSTIGSWFATSFISQAAWQPERLRTRDAMRDVARQFIGAFAIGQAREFWPEIRRHVLRRR